MPDQVHHSRDVVARVSYASRSMATDPSEKMKFDSYTSEKADLIHRLQDVEFNLSELKSRMNSLKDNSLSLGWPTSKYKAELAKLSASRDSMISAKAKLVTRLQQIKPLAAKEKRLGNNFVFRDDGAIDLMSLTLETLEALKRIEAKVDMVIRNTKKA